MKTWRPRLILLAAALMLAVIVAACSASGSRPDIDPTATSRSGPRPTSTPRFVHDRMDLCPRLPREACLLPGDVVNVYEALSLDQPQTLRVFHDQQQDWVLGDNVQTVLRMLDTEVTLEPWALRQSHSLLVELGRKNDRTYTLFELLLVDLDAQAMGLRAVEGQEVQWPVPSGFVNELLGSLSDVTPTPTETNTPAPYTPPPPPPTITPWPKSEIYFDHPEGELVWDGPDDLLTSLPRGHCGPPREVQETYGVPAFFWFGEDAHEDGHWYGGTVEPDATWERTGYHRDGWEIWRDPSQGVFSLINVDEPTLAFAYQGGGCD